MSGALSASAGVEDFEDGIVGVVLLLGLLRSGLLGRGLGNSMQKFLYIPEPENDFVFPIVVEELGLLSSSKEAGPVAQSADPAPAALRFGAIELNDLTRTVTVEGEPVELTFKEYALLHFFLEHPEEVLARERIMKAVWDTDDLLESRTIDMHVRTLRQKLGEAGESIRTVRKVGYKLSARGTEGTDET